MKQVIPIFFIFDKWYTLAAEVTFFGLLRYSHPDNHYLLYVLSANLPAKSLRRLQKIVNKFPNADIEYKDMTAYEKKYGLPEGKSHFSKEIFYKLIAAEVFTQYDRILCSDVDVVFKQDVAPALFDFPDDNFYFAGITWVVDHGKRKMYDNQVYTPEEQKKLSKGIGAGFLLMNLKQIRQDYMQSKMVSFYMKNYPRLTQPEQDCFNICCYPKIRYLHWKYCVLNYYYSMDRNNIKFFFPPFYSELGEDKENALAHFEETLSHPVQIHYVGANKPWNRLFVDCQSTWFKHAWRAGLMTEFVVEFPIQFLRTCRRYSLKRFTHKLFHRFFR